MRHLRSWPLVAIAILALRQAANAQETVVIPADIATVVTGGSWSSGSINGSYRVVVRTGGLEHVVSIAQIDWIVESEGPEEASRIVQSKIANTGSWRLDRPRILRSGSAWRVELDGLETHVTPTLRGKWILRLGPPGEVQSSVVTR
jgi:hypothetical protein